MEIIFAVVALALAVVFMPRPKVPGMEKPTLDDIDAPTVEQGRPVPMIFGSPVIEDPSVVWYGDLYVKPIKKKGGKK